jgi:hypothetical protein
MARTAAQIRAWNREYAARKRREAGVPAQGSAESTENRRNARKATGLEHGNWKGHEVGYFALHTWLNRNRAKTGVCESCGATPEPKKRRVATEWANVSGEYRRDVTDYLELCVSCHRKLDMTQEKRRKIGDAAKGRPVAAETRAKLSAATKRRWEQSRAS